MSDIREKNNHTSTVALFVALLAAVATAMLALVLSLAAGISKQNLVIAMVASGLVVGGIVFSLLELHRQGREKNRLKEISEIEAFEARLARDRAQAERDLVEPSAGTEPYRHHEDHMESPGRDQGQITSSWPAKTPFLEGSEKPSEAAPPREPGGSNVPATPR